MRRRWRACQPRGARRGQALVEMALLIPLMIILLLGCLQFGLLFQAYLSTMNATRDAARWLVVNPHQTDTTATTTLLARLPSNLQSAHMTIGITPTCAVLTASKCSGRTTGTTLTVTMTYDAAQMLFVPNPLHFLGYSVAMPTSLPAYSISMGIEPGS
jgi:Flp pilus assembly protein TadG